MINMLFAISLVWGKNVYVIIEGFNTMEKGKRRQSKTGSANQQREWLIMQLKRFNFSPFLASKKTRYVFLRLLKCFLLFSTGVYLWTLPFYYFLVACPCRTADFLMPFEVIFCSILSFIMFGWFSKTVWEIWKHEKQTIRRMFSLLKSSAGWLKMSNKPTIEEINELEKRLRCEARKVDKPLK